MVQTTGSDRRLQRRDARREQFVAVARDLAAESGIEGLTMKLLADRMDCAVGTAYSYFASKGALVAAVQAEAIDRLARAYELAAPGVEPLLDDLDERGRSLGRLVAFGRFVVAAERVMAPDFHLQRQLLGSPVTMEPADADSVVPVAFDLLGRPQRLLTAASDLGALAPGVDDGVGFERAITWLAAVNGVLTLDAIQAPAAGLFDTALLADRLSFDLLSAWGADPVDLATAADLVPLATVQRLLATVADPSDQETSA